MAKHINELRKKIKPEIQAAARAKALAIIAEMELAEVRKARGLSQATVAKRLEIAQPNVSQFESRPDLLLSTLNQYIDALGGRLEIYASFPDGERIELSQYSQST